MSDLEDRVEDLENHYEALSRLPQRVIEINSGQDQIITAIKVMRETFESRFNELNRKAGALVVESEDSNGNKQVTARKVGVGVDWKLIVGFIATCVVPIVTTILLTSGGPK